MAIYYVFKKKTFSLLCLALFQRDDDRNSRNKNRISLLLCINIYIETKVVYSIHCNKSLTFMFITYAHTYTLHMKNSLVTLVQFPDSCSVYKSYVFYFNVSGVF